MVSLLMCFIMDLYKIHDEDLVANGWREPQVVEDMDSTDIDVDEGELGPKGEACVALRKSKKPVVVGIHGAEFRHLTVLVSPLTGETGSFNHNKYTMSIQCGDIWLKDNRTDGEVRKMVYCGSEQKFHYSSGEWLMKPAAHTSGGNKSLGIQWHATRKLEQVVIPVHQILGVMYYGRDGLDGIEERGCILEYNHRNGDHDDNRLINIETIPSSAHNAHKEFLKKLRFAKLMCVLLLLHKYYGH